MDLLPSDSDWETSSESGMEDQEEIDFLYSGQARSILSCLEQSIEKIDDFLSFERGFMHGDMIFSVTDPSGQMGRVIGVDMLVDLENVHGKIVKDVNSKNLSKIRSFSAGDYVVCGPWIGQVDKVVDHVTVVFDDGTKYEVNTMDQDKLVPISPNILEDVQYPYYPGQRVKVKLSTVSKSTRWLCGTWRESQDEGTVCTVEAGLVYVDWLTSILAASNPDLPSPPRVLDSTKLTLLSCFLHANWQLGDWCMLPVSGHKGVMEQKFEGGVRGRKVGSNFDEILVIVKTKTKVNVMWQNGSISMGLDSQKLLPVSVVNSYEFCPEQFVLEKGTCDDQCSGQRWGVVLGMDAKERTVKVQWKTLSTAGTEDLGGKQMVETVSAYELVEHPHYCYCFGDLVSRVVQNQFDDHADKNNDATVGERDEVGKSYGRDENKFPEKCYLSCIGTVIGFKHGAVVVKWASGITSKIAPYEIYRIDKHDRTATVSLDEDVDSLNEGMTEHDKQTTMVQKGTLNSDGDGDGDGSMKLLWESTSFFIPQAAIRFFTSIASSLLGSSCSTSLSNSTPSVHIPGVASESGIPEEKGIVEGSDKCNEPQIIHLDTFVKKMLNKEAKELPENKDLLHSTRNENQDKFKQFDMAVDCSDHNFISTGKGFVLPQVKRSWAKKVQQEWSILEKDLPETIYVRIFEERMDLIRAAIVGAPGTPYHDGLFFFDIYLPPEYPQEPPMVHYIAGGLRVNPNLYESGKVCLSLLNTWTGTDTEVWNPGSSSILQVLLSLQALVLNEKPYFNEAGYDQQMGKAEGEKNSASYNENAFLMTCKSMLYLLRKPPKHFEALVEEHFSRRSQHILMACKAYMEGAPVGCAVGHGETIHDHRNGSSTGFKIMLSKLFPKLMEAFSDKGIDCSQRAMPEK